MNIGTNIKSSNIAVIADAIKEAAEKGSDFDSNIHLRFESDDSIPCGYYDFSIGNVQFKNCFVYPARIEGHYKGLMESVTIKVEADK